MDSNPVTVNNVTLLITHFNRSASLTRLLKTFASLNICFYEIIVSDGGSKDEHLNEVKKLQTIYNFTLVTTDVNKGLGNSINVGQDAVKSPYILYVQEDFVPLPGFVSVLRDGLEFMENESQWDLIRFYSFPWAPFPYLKPYLKGFSKMIFSLAPWYSDQIKFFVYSDHPHLKRATFPDKFGRYLEDLNSDKTENSMCFSFLKKGGKALYYTNHTELFEHINTGHEPGLLRTNKQKTKKLADIAIIYKLYLKFKLIKQSLLFVLKK